MKYYFSAKFVTDGDYGFSLIPPTMHYDGEDYWLSEDFKDFKSLKDYINWLIPVLDKHLVGRETEVETLKEKFYNLLVHVNSKNGEKDYSFYFGGNYDGTEVGYYANYNSIKFHISFNDDEYEKYKKSNLSYKDVHNAILKLIDAKLKGDE